MFYHIVNQANLKLEKLKTVRESSISEFPNDVESQSPAECISTIRYGNLPILRVWRYLIVLPCHWSRSGVFIVNFEYISPHFV